MCFVDFDIGSKSSTPVPATNHVTTPTSSNQNTLTRSESNFYTDQNHGDSSGASESTNHHNSSSDLSNSSLLRNTENEMQNLSISNTYQNDDFLKMQTAEYCNRETFIVCDNNKYDERNINSRDAEKSTNKNNQKPTITGTIRKIPENLKLNEIVNELDNAPKPSPSLSTSSGPYIPISECFSGSPILPPNNQLNSLDPRFYDTPRSHNINIGLNLTDDQPYSPKRNNCSMTQSRSGQSSPTDSESVFTDDEWSQTESMQGTLDRKLRPSDSSIENEAIGWTYMQRFSRVDTANNKITTEAPPRPPKRIGALVLNESDKNKDLQTSDTENASPAIGPQDSSSVSI